MIKANITGKLAKELVSDIPDCFRADPDTIDKINKIIKEIKDND